MGLPDITSDCIYMYLWFIDLYIYIILIYNTMNMNNHYLSLEAAEFVLQPVVSRKGPFSGSLHKGLDSGHTCNT